jgi:mRNA-degrading endonuclease YafQ of YafQ-DinJ toxin-antitoxin module
MCTLSASKKYQKQSKKIIKQNPHLRLKITKILHLMSEDPTHPSLRLHKLSGKETWSVSVTMSVRIIIGIRRRKIYLLEIGKHDDVY